MSDALDRLRAALADRYAIERQLGEGGMATVYLATDLRHHRKVALKVLRPELAATVGPERFLQEVQVTANLQHPHILPLFDSGVAGGFLYYVMPYLDGESLRERLAREGELPVADAVRILTEVVDALAAAHQAGVVHRDIKPDNVMLTGRHAVVTDFGVAKAVSEATGRHQLTTKGVALGTPAYMAPEQAAADEHIDHRVDIYAVGAMGYELLAGRPPFTGMTARQVLAAHVTEVPRAVTELRESVPASLGGALMRCLEKKPADRWQSAEELLHQLETFATPVAGITPAGSKPVGITTGTPLWMKVVLPVALVAVALAVWLGQREAVTDREADGDEAATANGVTERLVVIPLENLTDDPELDVLGRLAADQVARSIDQPEPIPVVPSSTVRDAYRTLGDEATTKEVAEAVRATHALAGTIASAGGQLRMEIELVDVRTGARLRTFEPVVGRADSAEALVAELAAAVTAGTVAQLDPDWGEWIAGISVPVSLEAFELYQREGDLFCSLDYDKSIEVGRQVVALSPEFVPALIFMGVAMNNLGRNAEADSVFEILGEMRDGMTTAEGLVYEWMMGNRTGDPDRSTRAAEEGYRLDPAGWGGYAMIAALRTNRMNDAVDRYYATDRPGPCPWLGIWTESSIPFHALGRYEEELAVAREGLEYWPDNRALMDIEIRAFAGMGRLDAVDSVLSVMASLPPMNGHDPALRPVWAAAELRAHGLEAEAKAMFDEAIARFPTRTTSTSPYNLGRAYYLARRWEEAEPILRDLVAARPDNLAYLTLYGVTLAKRGDRNGALEIVDRLGEVERSNLRGANIMDQAVITAALGDADEALRLFQEAFDDGAPHGVWIHRDPALDDMRSDPRFQALMRPR
jgi:tetratricopeptide (TPR) repeat protein/TolB-like protein